MYFFFFLLEAGFHPEFTFCFTKQNPEDCRNMGGDATFNSEGLLSQDTYYAIAVIYALLSATAFVLNTLVIFTFVKDRSLLLPTNLLILSISVADWLMAVVANPIGVAANVSKAWSLGRTSCVFYAFVTTCLGFAAIIHHTAIAVERYLSVTRPYMTDIPNKVMISVISALWGFALLWSVFPLFGWSAYVPEGGNTACSIRWQSTDVTDASYVYAIFTLFFFTPIIINITAYTLMYRTVKWMSVNAVKVWGVNAEPTLEIVMAKAKVAKMSSIMVTGFLIGWTPYAVVSLYAASGRAENISPLLGSIPSMFAKTTTSYNPIIYFFTYSHFRVSLQKSLRTVFRRVSVAPESTGNQNNSTREETVNPTTPTGNVVIALAKLQGLVEIPDLEQVQAS